MKKLIEKLKEWIKSIKDKFSPPKLKLHDDGTASFTATAMSSTMTWPSNITGAAPAVISPPVNYTINSGGAPMYTINGVASPFFVGAGGGGGGAYNVGAYHAGGGVPAGGYGYAFNPPTTNIITLSTGGTEIVRLNTDGTVTWANGIDIDAAAEAFTKAITLGAELQAGITKGVKLRMRDSVFEDLIEIAKNKGQLTAEDLTYLLESSKIVEKLKGGKE